MPPHLLPGWGTMTQHPRCTKIHCQPRWLLGRMRPKNKIKPCTRTHQSMNPRPSKCTVAVSYQGRQFLISRAFTGKGCWSTKPGDLPNVPSHQLPFQPPTGRNHNHDHLKRRSRYCHPQPFQTLAARKAVGSAEWLPKGTDCRNGKTPQRTQPGTQETFLKVPLRTSKDV